MKNKQIRTSNNIYTAKETKAELRHTSCSIEMLGVIFN